MKRLVIFILGMLIVMALLIAAVPFFLSADFVGEQLKTVVLEKTGRRLSLNGPLRFKLWPTIAVEANDVTLSNPPDMFKGQFAAVKTLRVQVRGLPLFSRKVVVKELVLIGPRISLIVDGKGLSNWRFSLPDRGSVKGSDGTPAHKPTGSRTPTRPGDVGLESVKLAPLIIRNGDVRFLDERSGSAFAVSAVNMTIALPRIGGPVDLSGSLLWNKQKITIKSFIKRPIELTGRGSAMDISLASGLFKMGFDGRARIEQGLSLAGIFSFQTTSLRKLAAFTGNPLAPGKGLGPFSAKGKLDLAGQSIKFADARISIDGMNARGGLSVMLGGRRPRLAANLGMDRIDLNKYVAAKAARGQKSPSSNARHKWSTTKIDFSGLKAVDARLSIATSQILYRDIVIGRSQVRASLKDGVLNAKLAKMAFYDGHATGQLVLNGGQKTPVLQGALSASGLNAYRLLKDFADFKRLEGTGQIKMSLAGRGHSQAQLVKSLAGTAQLKFTNGAIRGINIAAMVRNVQKTILGGWDKKNPQQKTDFSELSMSFTIKNGIARSDDLKLMGPLVRLSGKGKLDIPRQYMDYRVEPKLVATLKGQGGAKKLKGLAVPVIAKGPWDSPKIYPDIEGILENPQAAFNKLSKLLNGKTGIDLQKAKKQLGKKATEKVQQVLKSKAGKTVEKITGKKLDQKKAAKAGKKLLKGLFGKKKEPAAQ